MNPAQLPTRNGCSLSRITHITPALKLAMRKYFSLASMDTPFSYPLFGRGKGQAIDRKQVKEMRKAL